MVSEVLAADRTLQALGLAEEIRPALVLLEAVLPDPSVFANPSSVSCCSRYARTRASCSTEIL
jgi:hypothetical protein